MPRFKPSRVPAVRFVPKTQGCSWCIDRVPPTSGGICDVCVARFKRWLQSRQWQGIAKAKLYRDPDCQCEVDCGRPADTVDHKLPWRTSPQEFWNTDNLQSLHHNCHQLKTNREAAELKRRR